MYTIQRTGSLAAAIAQARDIPARVIPYATAAALTRTAKSGQAAVVAQMPQVFDRPTRYTLNATRIVAATKDSLTASVQVKTQAAGTVPQHYLLPEVLGGTRRRKRLETALRYQGILGSGQWMLPGQAMRLDSAGNVSAATSRQLLAVLKTVKSQPTRAGAKGGKRARSRALLSDLFTGKPRGGNRPAGIWRREGQRIRPLFIFSDQTPQYRRRLNWDGIVAPVVRQRFAAEFARAVNDIINRR